MSVEAPPGLGVQMVARAIAAGFDTETGQARVTVSLMPDCRDGPYRLPDWPGHLHSRLPAHLPGRPDGRTARDGQGPVLQVVLMELGPGQGTGTPVTTVLKVAPAQDTQSHVLDLWRRVMAPDGPGSDVPWQDLRRFMGGAGQSCPSPSASFLETPAPHVALALSLERGRAVLEAVAGRAAGRPAALAGLDGITGDAVLAQAAPQRWLTPIEAAHAALHGAGAHKAVQRRLHDAHALTTPHDADEGEQPQLTPEEKAARNAGRRMAAVLADPVLQRLFGLAVDVLVPLPDLGGDRVFRLGVRGFEGRAVWTLAKLRNPPLGGDRYFGPATRQEAEGGANAGSAEGVVLLSQASGDAPRYELCTLDPELAAESNQLRERMRVNGQVRPDQVTTLRSGGLRLLDRLAAHHAAKKCQASAPEDPAALDQAADDQAVKDQAAEDLETHERLDIGVDTATGTVWRSVMHRIVRYTDPGRGGGWMERELERLCGPADGVRRIELAAAPVVRILRDIMVDRTPSSDPAGDGAVVLAQATVAAWSGEPMGAALTAGPERTPGALGINQVITLSDTRQHHELRSISLRFGWPYRAGLRQVFVGGVTRPLADMQHAYASLQDAMLPAAGGGRRMLRHERVGPPSLGMTRMEWQARGGLAMRQATNHAVVRSGGGVAGVPARTVRLLLAPGVPLEFAAMHDVLRRHAGGRPPGARGGALHPAENTPDDAHKDGTAVLDPADPRGPFYPDPAATMMVLRLRVPGDPQGWLGEPVVLDIADPDHWPSAVPVHVEVRRTMQRGSLDERLQALPGPRWLASSGALAEAGQPGALRVAAVQAHLLPGEDLVLGAWCVPTIGQLAAWFDPVEAAGVLAAAAGTGPTAALRCISGLGLLTAAAMAPSGPPVMACTGAGGLPAPGAATLRQVAAMLHQAMLRHPVLAVAAVQECRLTHATALPASAPAFSDREGDRLVVVRRRPPASAPPPEAKVDAKDNRTDASAKEQLEALQQAAQAFVTSTSSGDWTLSSSDEGATAAIFGGEVSVDPATTSGVELHALAAGAGGRPLDDGRGASLTEKDGWAKPGAAALDFRKLFGFDIHAGGHVELVRTSQKVFRIDGLPPPADGTPAVRAFRLEMLQEAAWGKAHPFGKALTVALASAFSDPGARRLTMTAVAINRHGELMPPKTGLARKGKGVDLWLPATKRPAPPEVYDVVPLPEPVPIPAATGAGGWRTIGVERGTRVRVRLRRPWFSSGEGEMLGVVLWPPALFAQGPDVDELGQDLPEALTLMDADLGPGGTYATRWAADPIRETATPPGLRLLPWGAITSTPGQTWSKVPSTFMPLPADATQGSGLAGGAATLLVSLLAVTPRFDPVDELWFVDLDLDLNTGSGPVAAPFIRLGLVRHQPHAREDRDAPGIGDSVCLRTSTPVSTWFQPLPGRRAEATWRVHDGLLQAYVTVRGSSAPGDGQTPAPGVRIELLTRAPLGQEGWLAARDDQGEAVRWESWADGAGALSQAFGGGWAWTCMLTAPTAGRHAVFIEEVERMKPATPAGNELDGLVETGPSFVAMIELHG